MSGPLRVWEPGAACRERDVDGITWRDVVAALSGLVEHRPDSACQHHPTGRHRRDDHGYVGHREPSIRAKHTPRGVGKYNGGGRAPAVTNRSR
jgi:hypothetical protein